MGKSKKSKKDVELEETSDDDTQQQQPSNSSDADNQEITVKKPTKKSKNDKKKLDVSDDEEDPPHVGPSKNSKKSKRDKKKSQTDEDELLPAQPISAFALLQDDASNDDAGSDTGVQSEEQVVVKKPKQKKKPKKKVDAEDNEDDSENLLAAGKKAKKPRKKRNDTEDEDLDQMLAELQLEYADEKKTEPGESGKGKKKPIAPVDQPAETESAEPAAGKKTKKKKKGTAVDETPAPVESISVPLKDEAKPEHTEPATEDSAAAKKKKGPGKAMVAAMQEALKKKKEEEERLEREEEERIRRIEEAEKIKEEQKRLEQERKDRKKQKERERKERAKAEGRLLTAKEKADKARAAAMLESLKAQGVEVPGTTEKKVARLGTRIRQPKPKKEIENTPEAVVEDEAKPEQIDAPENQTDTTTLIEEVPPAPIVVEEVKDSWEAFSDDEKRDRKSALEPIKKVDPPKSLPVAIVQYEKQESTEQSDEESSEESSDDESSDDESSAEEAIKQRERAEERIRKREAEAEKKRTLENLRAAVVCVLGHVDTGKTKILDKLRRTNVQDGEAGGITQQIGATNVPIENIKDNTKHVKGYQETKFKIPGLLIIDTPGHESFSNLRSRGSSLCDIAILVVDIMHGLEPQTIESLNLLKQRKTPFVVALNKIDRLYDWKTMPRKDVQDIIKGQALNTQQEFQKRLSEVVLQFNEQGMNAALFYDNPDPRTYISLVPTSAITGEGMGNLLMLIVQFSQNQLAKRLMYSETLQATVLEVKVIPGLGTTIDAILINGKLREGDTMILAGTDGPIVTQIKALLMPQPMKELRVKNAYIEYKEIIAAQGVKIAAKELEKAIAGINMQVARERDEIEIYKQIVEHDLKSVLRSIKLSEHGVFVQASTLGSLEALLEFLKSSKIPYAGIKIGPVVKRDVMKASIMLEHKPEYATILAFDVKIERDAQEKADNLAVKIFQADIIYHLFDKFTAYCDELKQSKRDQFKSVAVFPCKLKVLPQFVFNSRDPIVCGVTVEAGILKEGTPICVPTKEFVELGLVTSIENNHKNVETARKGQEVCIKIEPIPGEAPKMFGRHFDETDFLVSKISRQSIDACKDYFRDDLLKSDWALMVELKKTFQIL